MGAQEYRTLAEVAHTLEGMEAALWFIGTVIAAKWALEQWL